MEADISDLKPGEMKVFEWRGKPVWILKRTEEMMASLEKTKDKVADPASEKRLLPAYARVLQKQSPLAFPNTKTSWSQWAFAPIWAVRQARNSKLAHNLRCQMTGMAASSALATAPPLTWQVAFIRNKPAPTNLDVPPHMYLSDTKILIGKDEKGEG